MARRNSISSTAQQPLVTWEAVSYASPNSFTVAGRNATSDYSIGTVVKDFSGRFASVVYASYNGTDTTVLLSDDVCFPGMTRIGRATKIIGPNACVGGTPIAGGYHSAQYAQGYAFDGRFDTWFLSTQVDIGVAGEAWIGYTFAAAKKIRWFAIIQANYAAGITSSIAAVNLQYYNGSTWVNAPTYNYALNAIAGVPEMRVQAAHSYSSTQWRLLAAANVVTTGCKWGVIDVRMGE